MRYMSRNEAEEAVFCSHVLLDILIEKKEKTMFSWFVIEFGRHVLPLTIFAL